MQKIVECARATPLLKLEAIRACISAPWDAKLEVTDNPTDGVQAAVRAQQAKGIRVAPSASARNQMVGIGGVSEGIGRISSDIARREYDKTIGGNTQVNAYTAALASISMAAGMVAQAVDAGTLSPRENGGIIRISTNNRTALIAIRTPKRLSGQAIVDEFWSV